MGLWNTIRKGWDAINNKFSFILGDGRRVKFWKGRWYGLGALCNYFKRFLGSKCVGAMGLVCLFCKTAA